MNSGSKRSIAINIPEVIANNKIKAKEPVNCQEKKEIVTTAMFCRAKITETTPSNKPITKSIII